MFETFPLNVAYAPIWEEHFSSLFGTLPLKTSVPQLQERGYFYEF